MNHEAANIEIGYSNVCSAWNTGHLTLKHSDDHLNPHRRLTNSSLRALAAPKLLHGKILCAARRRKKRPFIQAAAGFGPEFGLLPISWISKKCLHPSRQRDIVKPYRVSRLGFAF